MNVLEKLAKLKQITQAQQTYGTQKLALAGIEYDDGTIQGVNEHIPGKGSEGTITGGFCFSSAPVVNEVYVGGEATA